MLRRPGRSTCVQRVDDRKTSDGDRAAARDLPMFENAITSLDWLWEPEITAEIDSQVQAIVKGATEPRSAGAAIEAVAQDLRSSGRSYYS